MAIAAGGTYEPAGLAAIPGGTYLAIAVGGTYDPGLAAITGGAYDSEAVLAIAVGIAAGTANEPLGIDLAIMGATVTEPLDFVMGGAVNDPMLTFVVVAFMGGAVNDPITGGAVYDPMLTVVHMAFKGGAVNDPIMGGAVYDPPVAGTPYEAIVGTCMVPPILGVATGGTYDNDCIVEDAIGTFIDAPIIIGVVGGAPDDTERTVPDDGMATGNA